MTSPPTSPGRFDELPRLERLALAARRIGGGILAQAPPRLPVGGTELTGYRDYAVGDDPRHVDWNVCARHDELRVRLYAGQPDWHARVLLDGSASMALGRPAPRFEIAARVAAALGYVALDRGATLSVHLFSDRLDRAVGPLRGRGRAGLFLRRLGSLGPGDRKTDFRLVAERFLRLPSVAGPVVVISDFEPGTGFLEGLETLRRGGCQVRAVRVVDPAESDPVSPGDVELVDAETGAAWRVSLTAAQLQRYLALLVEERRLLERRCRELGIPCVPIDLDWREGDLVWTVIREGSPAA